MRDKRKSMHTDRPLTEYERIFASEPENYKQLFTFMSRNGLNADEWYDILIIPYLSAVKKYCSREELHIYPFWSILTRVLSCAYHHHYRSLNAQKSIPRACVVSLDYNLQGDNPFCEYQIDEWWIDHRQQTEKVVFDRYMVESILMELNATQSRIFEMLLEGYSKVEIGRQLTISQAVLKRQLEKMQCVVSGYLSM